MTVSQNGGDLGMSLTWQPSRWGRLATRATDWRIESINDSFRLLTDDSSQAIGIRAMQALVVRRGLFWSQIDLTFRNRQVTLTGIPNKRAHKLRVTINALIWKLEHSPRIKLLKPAEVNALLAKIDAWSQEVLLELAKGKAAHRWITREQLSEWNSRKPHGDLGTHFVRNTLSPEFRSMSESVNDSVRFWKTSLPYRVRALNETHVKSELIECRSFFETVERSPLTDEQARAVICFDNRVQVIASAGSGKTSTMVAKAGYALHRKLVAPERILMLAFNKKATADLRLRTSNRLTPLGLDAEKVSVRTFHKFGLEVIGSATGTKPTLAPWLDDGGDIETLMSIVKEGRARSASFRIQWELFRRVLARDLAAFGEDQKNPEDWDSASRKSGFRTTRGDLVASQGERTIADWLFFNGVEYEYERPYEHDVADSTHRQYRPDFYYPSINAYHEHWGLDRSGKPPASFTGYTEGMEWKKALHRERHTTLLETTWAGVCDGSAFDHLAKEFTSRGVTLNPDPDRPMPGKQPIKDFDLARTFRAFLIHAKSNQLSDEDLRHRLRSEPDHRFKFRDSVFLRLFELIRFEWERNLKDSGYIDFEDMLNRSADLLESGKWESPYDLVLVDEMQDSSHARARLARALVNRPGRHLFGVGDDWQSINRFAGADISVMTGFDSWFGAGETLFLQRTFRSPQSLCDISSAFVKKNPSQLSKQVWSSSQEFSPSLRAITVASDTDAIAAIRDHLAELDRQVTDAEIPTNKDGKVTVDILGRYQHDKNLVPSHSSFRGLKVTFRTVHGSKGLEADYIVIPGLTKGSYGFPSSLVDDPVLRLVMPDSDTFPLGEERRLFYVALTRARRSVLLVTIATRESPFLVELVKDGVVQIETADGVQLEAEVCPRCREGLMVERGGKYGPFLACSRFPQCTNKSKLTVDQSWTESGISASGSWKSSIQDPPRPAHPTPSPWGMEDPEPIGATDPLDPAF